MIFFIQTWEEGSHVKLSTTTRYGLRALSDLCAQGGEGPVAVSDIARRQDIPANYLEQLFARLAGKIVVNVGWGIPLGIIDVLAE